MSALPPLPGCGYLQVRIPEHHWEKESAMKSLRLTLPVLALAIAPALMASEPVHAANNTGAVIGGLIAGAAIGAAVSSANRHPPPVYVPRPPPPPPPGPNPWANAFYPQPGYTCYPVQQACYKRNGAYAPVLTARIWP
jgi:hypothetical protein